MASSTPKLIPIQITSLALFYTNLARALAETGISGSQLNEILTTRLKARCVKCDIQLASVEIEQVSLVEDPTQLSHPKLKRLRLGYCARDGCESDDYQIQLDAFPGVDWETIEAKANALMSAQQVAARDEAACLLRRQCYRRTKRAVLSLLAVAVGVLLLFVWRHGRLPFVKKTPKYQIDPASVNEPLRR